MKRIHGLSTLAFSAGVSMACAIMPGCASGGATKPATAAILRLREASSGLTPSMHRRDGTARLERFQLYRPVDGGDPIDATNEIWLSNPVMSEEAS